MAKLQSALTFSTANLFIFLLEREGNEGGGIYNTNTALNSAENRTRRDAGLAVPVLQSKNEAAKKEIINFAQNEKKHIL